MLTSMTTLLLAGTAFVIYEQITLRYQMVHDLTIQANIIGENCRAPLTFNDIMDAEDVLASLKENSSILLARLVNQEGEVLAEYVRAEVPAVVKAIHCDINEHRFTKGYLTLSQGITVNNQQAGHITLLSNLDQLNRVLKQNITIVGSLVLLLSLMAFFVSSQLEKGISQPILQLSKTTKDIINHKTYSQCEIEHGNDEIGMLIESFNTMITDLSQSTTSIESLHGTV